MYILEMYLLLILAICCKDSVHSRQIHLKKRRSQDLLLPLKISDITYYPLKNNHTFGEKPMISIFLHAALGTFHKIRGNGTWGYGKEILNEMLITIKTSGLLDKVNSIYIGLLGAEQDRLSAKEMIYEYSDKVELILEADNLYFAEFPTLYTIQNYAEIAHNDTLILYMHTKGMRNNGAKTNAFTWNEYNQNPAHFWRRYMTYFLVERHSICIEAIRSRNHLTCGVLKQANVYAGNFWWSSVSWLKTRLPKIDSYRWEMHERMKAEDMLLKDISFVDHQRHYCIHHSHHNMYDCPTYRKSYETFHNYTFRANADCFSFALGNPKCFLENETLPII